ncbi:MAG: DUF1822 family protein [Cyanobacteria bacterium P01_F01_bin.150]
MIPTTLKALDEEAIPVFITQDAQQLAQGFASQQATPAKSNQVYRNTLAVLAVKNYLQILGISTDVAHCDSWNPMMRVMVNTADLDIVGQGRLECRPLSTEELQANPPTCYIPTEVQGDRIGYVVVHLEETEATLLGFAPNVDAEQFPLSQLQPFSDLLPHIHRVTLEDVEAKITTLSNWFNSAVEAGWYALEDLLKTPEMLVQYRQSSRASSESRQRAKVISSTTETDILLVGTITAPTDFTAANTPMGIQLKIHPSAPQSDLPSGLQLRLFDETGTTLMEAINTENHRLVKLDFEAEIGDRFDIQIQWPNIQGEHTVITERFVV